MGGILLLPSKYHLRKGMSRRVGNAQRNVFHAQLIRDLPRLAFERQRWPPALLPPHFNVHPPHASAPTRAQRFHRRLFHCKASRIALKLVLEPFAILSLLRRENSP